MSYAPRRARRPQRARAPRPAVDATTRAAASARVAGYWERTQGASKVLRGGEKTNYGRRQTAKDEVSDKEEWVQEHRPSENRRKTRARWTINEQANDKNTTQTFSEAGGLTSRVQAAALTRAKLTSAAAWPWRAHGSSPGAASWHSARVAASDDGAGSRKHAHEDQIVH
eukprot:6177977-Pleurochrysis_carterae.AAC.2